LSDQNSSGWLNDGRLMDLQRFPYGEPRLGDFRYRIAGTPLGAYGILMRGRFTAENTPDHLEIPVDAQASELRFLHTCAFAASQGEEVGGYEIVLKDGTSYRLPLIYGENIRAWDDPYASTSRHAVWKNATLSGTSVAIKQLAWDNPKPEVPVAIVRVFTKYTDASLVLLGISGLDPERESK
jgi:hypothetical protein